MSEGRLRGRVCLVGGGTRSGKSAFALELARARGRRRVFVATAQAFDDEMRARIDAHVTERGGEFETREEPHDLVRLLRSLHEGQHEHELPDIVVIDCVTLWLSNLLLSEQSPSAIGERIAELCAQLALCRFDTVLVTNEVGMGVVPESSLGRVFRDVAGLANQRLAALAGEVYWAMLGSILRIRPEPIRVHLPGSPIC